MLAKIVNDDAANQAIRGALQVFASKLAPTGKSSDKKPENPSNKKSGKPGNKKPDIIIGLEVARQAGKSVGCR
ncbi:hypothetical protein SO486_04860 [Pseudomonas salmasensis]|uniref:Uncharacterized protein n=1 Tax=Pseudomonas salmasensis TaxID=2745514 RepID=A0ABU5FDI5_9PSED|nr:hypothetical protein [Pseudomonas salmasensis]MDY4299325.1 hypothetical protein [Pseudomonas salmasensis]